MKKQRQTYSREFKFKLVELCKAKGNISAVSREYEVNIKSLHRWIAEFDHYEAGSFPGRGTPKQNPC